MFHVALFLIFTAICKPGIIYEYDGTSTDIIAEDNNSYYEYNNLEFPDGVYLYKSNNRDSVWFIIEGKEISYLCPSENDSINFEIKIK
jgi:hypothetical protein